MKNEEGLKSAKYLGNNGFDVVHFWGVRSILLHLLQAHQSQQNFAQAGAGLDQ